MASTNRPIEKDVLSPAGETLTPVMEDYLRHIYEKLSKPSIRSVQDRNRVRETMSPQIGSVTVTA